ncbi:uncharacterized protein LOC101176418 [Nomascus leucogenys]|uniref:uncharacterized protein LOC101176418 n=1 Tax=Nomascus leucogenys TaxID=61853 RepID=UPI00122DA0E0|nr:uncharacterized protein LOC101176418 [Nomascus leucogenys]XP_030654343.1 uncharacterized protein LOC101176418 [Nomascus leucogenys]
MMSTVWAPVRRALPFRHPAQLTSPRIDGEESVFQACKMCRRIWTQRRSTETNRGMENFAYNHDVLKELGKDSQSKQLKRPCGDTVRTARPKLFKLPPLRYHIHE